MKDAILITGYKGFIGSHILKELKGNFDIIKLNKIDAFKNVNNHTSYFKKFKIKQNGIKSLIHCSYYTPNSDYSEIEQLRLNKIVTKNITYLIKKYEIKKCIFLSSMAVYDTTKSKFISEKSKITKKNVYAKAKLKDESNFFRLYKNNHLESVTILRLPGVVGKNSKNNFISNLANAIVFSKKFNVNNPDFKFNNIVHIKTLINFIKLILFSSKKKFNIFNLGSHRPIKVKKIVNLMVQKLNSEYDKIFFDKKKINSFKINFNFAKKNGFMPNTVETELKNYIKDIK